MDEMKFKLSSKFMRNTVAKIITNIVRKKTGIKMELQINEIGAELVNGKIKFNINAGGELDESALMKINRIIEMDD